MFSLFKGETKQHWYIQAENLTLDSKRQNIYCFEWNAKTLELVYCLVQKDELSHKRMQLRCMRLLKRETWVSALCGRIEYSLGICPRTAASWGTLTPNFLRNHHVDFHRLYKFTLPPAMNEVPHQQEMKFPLIHILTSMRISHVKKKKNDITAFAEEWKKLEQHCKSVILRELTQIIKINMVCTNLQVDISC